MFAVPYTPATENLVIQLTKGFRPRLNPFETFYFVFEADDRWRFLTPKQFEEYRLKLDKTWDSCAIEFWNAS